MRYFPKAGGPEAAAIYLTYTKRELLDAYIALYNEMHGGRADIAAVAADLNARVLRLYGHDRSGQLLAAINFQRGDRA